MGRVRNSTVPHRSGPLKQTNKKHKTGKHRSKGMVDIMTRGRVQSTSSSSSRNKRKGMNKREERKKQAAIERMKKMSQVVERKKTIGGMRGAPILVGLIPLGPTTNVEFMLKFILSNIKGFGTIVGHSGTSTHIKSSSGKNVMLVIPPKNDIWAILDTLKQCDVSLWLLPNLDELTPEGWTLLKTGKEQGMPTPFVGIGSSSFTKHEEKAWIKGIQQYLKVDKLFPITNEGQISNLLRMMSVSKIMVPKQWSLRASMFIEECRPHHAVDPLTLHPNFVAAHPIDGHLNLVQVTGVIRHKNLNPYKPVLISGLGSFTILRADVTPMQVPMEFLTEEQLLQGPTPALPPRFLLDPLSIPPEDAESLAEENPDEEMGSDIDALSEHDFQSTEDDDSQSQMSIDLKETQGNKKGKLPKGTSGYQADWLLKEDGNPDEDIIGSDEELEDDKGSESEGDEDEEEMDWEEERRQLQILKDAKTEAEFPDWVDTPLEIPAKTRFQKYRGLQSFKTSTWDVNENLPKEYAKICQFQNYKHVYKVVVTKGVDDGPGFIPIGQRVTLLLKPSDETAGKQLGTIGSSHPVSLVSLLRHEMRMSVLNIQLNLSDVLKNKDDLIFQLGYHRFTAKPILSEISTGNKHKMLRYGQMNQTCMATVYAPLLFPPATVVAFKTVHAELVPVGAGHLFSIDPSRLVIKRVLLSGHPFKVMNRKAVVRFMFFNREDIEWFKPVELKTRYGRRGHIKEPLGTHGHMKCTFDGQVKSQDTVLMPLYKRVFPKWNYDTIVPSFVVFDSYRK